MKLASAIKTEAPVVSEIAPDITHKLSSLNDQRLDFAAAQRLLNKPTGLVNQRPVDNGRGEQVFQQNLAAMVQRVAKAHPAQTLAMLRGMFPNLKDFSRLKQLAELHVMNQGRPLRLIPLPSEVDRANLSESLAQRLHGDSIVLTDEEAVVFQNDRGWGPMPRELAFKEAAKAGAASPVHDAEGHLLDPEEALPTPAMAVAGLPEIC